jgi:hypothetical protein
VAGNRGALETPLPVIEPTDFRETSTFTQLNQIDHYISHD